MADSEEKEATERVVLRLHSEGTTEAGKGPKQLWEVIGTIRGTKMGVIDRLANNEPGKYRSVPRRSWKGGKEIVLPEKPKPETRTFE